MFSNAVKLFSINGFDIKDFKRLYEKRFGPMSAQLSMFPDFFRKD
jgi:hypothetical protein